MSEMAFARWATTDLVVTINTAKNPEPAEWDRFLACINDTLARHNSLRVLVFSDGAGPDASVRKRINQFLAGRVAASVVVTESLVVRTIVNAFNLFNPGIHGFDPYRMHDALAYLKLQPEQLPEILAFARTLTTGLGTIKALERASR